MYKDEAACQAAYQPTLHQLYQYITLFISILLSALTGIQYKESTCTQEPYHTSILTGLGVPWVTPQVTLCDTAPITGTGYTGACLVHGFGSNTMVYRHCSESQFTE